MLPTRKVRHAKNQRQLRRAVTATDRKHLLIRGVPLSATAPSHWSVKTKTIALILLFERLIASVFGDLFYCFIHSIAGDWGFYKQRFTKGSLFGGQETHCEAREGTCSVSRSVIKMAVSEVTLVFCCRLGEEKESAIRSFQQERLEFEDKTRDLLAQQDQLLQDRERSKTVDDTNI